MNKNCLVVGLTGQSGAGKTTVSKAFEQNGFYVIDCDIVARKAVLPESECVSELIKDFPQLFDGRQLDRKKAASLLFSDKNALLKYNSIIFPHITRLISEEISFAEKNGYEYILLDAPTLFEAGADSLCKVIVSCIADKSVRLQRIIERDKISAEAAKKRFSAQNSEEFFRQKSDYVIENNGERENAVKKTEEIIKQIKGNTYG